MQINSYSSNQNRPSFGRRPLFEAFVRGKDDLPVKVVATELEESDSAVLETLERNWHGYVYRIHKDFIKKEPVYAIELDRPNKSFSDNVLCLASATKKCDVFELNYLQTLPASCHGSDGIRDYKGAGAAMVYGLVKIAQEAQAKIFRVGSIASAVDFYEKHLKMVRNGTYNDLTYMIFTQQGMNDFVARQEAAFATLARRFTEPFKKSA